MQRCTLYKLMTSWHCVRCSITMMVLDANIQISTGCYAGRSTFLFWNFNFILISPPLSRNLSLFFSLSLWTYPFFFYQFRRTSTALLFIYTKLYCFHVVYFLWNDIIYMKKRAHVGLLEYYREVNKYFFFEKK